MSTIFTKIIQQEIPSYKLYEDEKVYCFLDIRPIQLGHSLIVPKQEVDYFADLDEQIYSHLMLKAHGLSRAIQKATECKRVGLIVAGYEVPHFHLHMIPTWDLSDFSFGKGQERPAQQMLEMQKKILEQIN